MSRVKTITSRVIIIVIAITAAAAFPPASGRVGVSKAAAAGKAKLFDPPAVYLTWQHDPTTTMTVQWHSDAGRDDFVQYQKLGERVWHTAVGTHHPMPHSDRVVHVVELTGLEPGTDYRFRFGEKSVAFTFRTMPRDARRPIRFVVGGDTMDPLDFLDEGFEATCRLAAQQEPMFAVIGGDIAYANGSPKRVKRWYRWLAGWKKYMVTSNGRLVPLLVAIGNHEVQGQYNQTPAQAPFFYSLFAMPGPRGYNVLDIGGYMSVVLLDSEHTHPIDGKQTDWLRRTLAGRQEVPHLFAVYHVPAYPSVRKFDNRVSTKVREHWVPVFEEFGVDVVFEHHDHAYKRTHPIRAGTIDAQGVLYLGDGGWGVLPRKPRERWYLAKTASTQHFILVRIDGRSRSFLAMDGDGQVIDEVHQTATPGATSSP
ncbi:MAG: purple acid phosphatase family protein [Candidatus Methylomirabilales bacterium]